MGGTDLRFHHPQLDTSLHYETTDMGTVHCVVRLFTPQLSLVRIYLPQRDGQAELTYCRWQIKYQDSGNMTQAHEQPSKSVISPTYSNYVT